MMYSALIVLLIVTFTSGDTPTVIDTFDTLVSEYSASFRWDNNDYDISSSYKEDLKVLHDDLTGCYVFYTNRRVYRGHCGSFGYSFPFASAVDTGFYDGRDDDSLDGDMDTQWSGKIYEIHPSGSTLLGTMRFARTWISEGAWNSNYPTLEFRKHPQSHALLKSVVHTGVRPYVSDYDLGESLTDVHQAKLFHSSDMKIREFRFFNEIPNVVERRFMTTDSGAIVHICNVYNGFLTCVVKNNFFTLDLSKPGVAHRLLANELPRIDQSTYYNTGLSFILPMRESPTYNFFVYFDNLGGDSRAIIRSLTGSSLSLNYSPINNNVITNAAYVDGTDSQSTYIVSSTGGKLFTLKSSGFTALDAQFGLGISSMYLYKSGSDIKGYLTLDTELGLLLEISITGTSVSIINVIIIGDERPHTMLYDSVRKGLILLCDDGTDGTVYIVSTTPLKSSSYKKVYPGYRFSSDASYDSSTMSVRVSEANCNSNCRIFNLDLDDCSTYSCEECGITNPVFCGACGTGSACSDDSACGSDFRRGITCPYLIGTNPSNPFSGSTAGGTVIEVFYAGPRINSVTCNYGGTTVTPSSINEGSFFCVSPPGTGTKTLSFTTYTDTFQFTYYDCSSFGCDDCSTYSECGWDANKATCAPLVSGGTLIDYCPGISKIDPSEYLIQTIGTGVELFIYTNGLTDGIQYRCSFVEVGIETAATFIRSDLLSCHTPSQTDLDLFNGIAITVTIESYVTSWVQHTQNAAMTFTPTVCSSVVVCSSCQELGCDYCDDNTCDVSGSCGGIISQCPAMGELSLTSDSIAGGSQISIQVENLFALFTKRALTGPLKCVFESLSNRYTDTAVVNDPNVTCTSPAGLPGSYNFYLADDTDVPIVTPLPFEIYDCTGKKCLECGSSLYPRCEYCGAACKLEGECGVIDGCPDILSVDPITVPITGGSINLNTEFISSNVTCVVNGEQSLPLSIIQDIVTCKVPGSSPGMKEVYLLLGIETTSVHQIQLYDCSYSTSCGDCLSPTYPACSFCDGSCRLQCPGEKSGCPIIASVSSLLFEIGGNELINIVFENPLSQNNLYRCVFEITTKYHTPAVILDQYTLGCGIPQNMAEGSYPFSIEVQYPSRSQFELYSQHDENVFLYKCASSLTCTDQCYSEYCTFCAGIGCTGNTGSVCLSENVLLSCPVITGISTPAYSIDTSREISINVTGFSLSSEGLICSFSTGSVVYDIPATLSGDVITCSTPEIASTTSLSLNIKYQNTIITNSNIQISVIDCSAAKICDNSFVETLCIDLDFCGWCVSSHSCTGLNDCNGPFLENGICPQFTKVSPNKTDVGEDVHLIGSHFYNFDLVADIGGEVVSVTFVNETHLLLSDIPTTLIRESELQVLLQFENRSSYLPYGRTLYVNIDKERDNTLLVVLLFIIAVIILASIIIGAIMLNKQMKENVFANVNIVLSTPDFSELAYGKDGNTIEWTNLPQDNFELFEDLLINDRTKGFFSAFMGTLSSTDLDRGTKYFTYITEINNCSLEFILALMEDEISNCSSAATIFRGNSIASKIFKTYSRIVGSPYLFDVLGKYIQQLSALCDAELGAFGLDLEVDDHKNQDKNADIESNSMQLKFVCNKLLTSILNSVEDVPLSFKEIFSHVNYHISISQFEDETSLYAIGGLFFLRFVIPSIFAPHVYGLLPNPPSVKTQRSLVLIAKVLQNVANMVLTQKEEFMVYLRSYVENSIPKVKQFYMLLTEVDNGSIPVPPKSPPHLRMNSLCQLYTIFSYNKGKIEEFLFRNQEFPEPYIRKITIATDSYIPPEKIKGEQKNKLKK